MSAETLVATCTVLERGWSKSMIERLLGDPDATRPNPHYRSGPPMRLYILSRVEAAEQSEAYVELAARKRARALRSTAQAQKRAEDLMTWVQSLTITVPPMTVRQLARRATENRNTVSAYHPSGNERAGFELANWRTTNPDTLYRWIRNYCRHGLTDYERLLDQRVSGQPGCAAAYAALRQMIDAAIDATYPDLLARITALQTESPPSRPSVSEPIPMDEGMRS